jgi:hypothetical protein
MSGKRTRKERYGDLRSVPTWHYLVNGQWHQLALAEARRIAYSTVRQGGTFRQATVDEELDLLGI